MAIVKHGSNAIETESVEMELLKPIFAIGKQEMKHLILSIIETKAVPCWMFATITLAEILIGITREIGKTLIHIFHRMTMYNIHYHRKSISMSLINECFQFLGSSETATRSKEIAYMIAKASIVRMLLNSHHLNTIISRLHDTRENILSKFVVCSHFLLSLRHSDMAFIDEQGVAFNFVFRILPHVWNFRIPHLRTEQIRSGILYYTIGPRRNAKTFSSVPMNAEFVVIAMFQSFQGKINFPILRPTDSVHGILARFFPSIEITYHIYAGCVGCPLTKHPLHLRFLTFHGRRDRLLMQAKIHIPRSKIIQCDFAFFGNTIKFIFHSLMTTIDSILIWLQVNIILDKFQR